jgi:hypothetical protein
MTAADRVAVGVPWLLTLALRRESSDDQTDPEQGL